MPYYLEAGGKRHCSPTFSTEYPVGALILRALIPVTGKSVNAYLCPCSGEQPWTREAGQTAPAREPQASAVGEGLLPDRLHGRTVGFQILHVVPAILRPSSDSSI